MYLTIGAVLSPVLMSVSILLTVFGSAKCIFLYSVDKNSDWALFVSQKKNYSSGRKRTSSRASKAQREDSIRRTVYVSDLDHNVSKNQ